jgi:hypothetical protein
VNPYTLNFWSFMKSNETSFEPWENQESLPPADGVHNHFHAHVDVKNSHLPNFLKHRAVQLGVAGLSALAVMGFIAEEEHWLPHESATVQPSPSLLKSVSWPESTVLDSGNTTKTMEVAEAWGGSLPLIGGLVGDVDKHSISTPVAGEVQVLLNPVNNTTPGVSMSWYKAGNKQLPGGKKKKVYGVQDTINYNQLQVQEVAQQCTGTYDQCIVNVHNSILGYAVELSPLNLATSALRLLPLADHIPIVGGIAGGLDRIIGNNTQEAATESQDLYVDAQQDMGQECSTGALLKPTLLAYGAAKATEMSLSGMASLDAKNPALTKASSYYAEAATLPVHVRFVDDSGNTATQQEIDYRAPAAISNTIFGKQFGSSAKDVNIVGGNSCNVDNVASQEISKAMNTEIQQKDETIVAARASEPAATN